MSNSYGAALQQLGTNLQAAVAAEMESIRTETAQQAAAVRQHFAQLWPWVVYGGLAICLVLVVGVWGVGFWLTSSIESYRADLTVIKADIKDGQEMLRLIDQQTGGLEVMENADGRLLIWARGGEPQKTTRGRWAVKLGK